MTCVKFGRGAGAPCWPGRRRRWPRRGPFRRPAPRASEVSAIQVSAVQQELTDAALACGPKEVAMFNRFQTVFGKELRKSDAMMLRMFKRLNGAPRAMPPMIPTRPAPSPMPSSAAPSRARPCRFLQHRRYRVRRGAGARQAGAGGFRLRRAGERGQSGRQLRDQGGGVAAGRAGGPAMSYPTPRPGLPGDPPNRKPVSELTATLRKNAGAALTQPGAGFSHVAATDRSQRKGPVFRPALLLSGLSLLSHPDR